MKEGSKWCQFPGSGVAIRSELGVGSERVVEVHCQESNSNSVHRRSQVYKTFIFSLDCLPLVMLCECARFGIECWSFSRTLSAREEGSSLWKAGHTEVRERRSCFCSSSNS